MGKMEHMLLTSLWVSHWLGLSSRAVEGVGGDRLDSSHTPSVFDLSCTTWVCHFLIYRLSNSDSVYFNLGIGLPNFFKAYAVLPYLVTTQLMLGIMCNL